MEKDIKKVAIIIAGGVGKRMGQEIPKQFINVYDKPIIIYTLEKFQNNPMIDYIEVVCVEGWEQVLKSYAKQFNISKLKWVVKGGETGQESIRNGIANLRDFCDKDDIVIIHDGIRPMIDDSILNDVITKSITYGNGVTSIPFTEQIFKKDDEFTTSQYIPRDELRIVSTPQAYKYKIIDDVYEDAFKNNKGIYGATYANTLMIDYGKKLYFAVGSSKNIKLTTMDDIQIFKALLKLESK